MQSLVVLVTGASSGIGRALALEFARRGHQLVLVGRDFAALQEVRDACANAAKARAICIVADLRHSEALRAIHESVLGHGLKVDVLVNNAGFAVHGEFVNNSALLELDLVHIQIDAMIQLTKMFLPGMLARGRGGLLNIASVYSFCPVPFQAVYGACKAFIQSFSEAVRNETNGTGITVTVVAPGTTRTAFRVRAGLKEKRPTSGLSAEEVAAQAYRAFMRGDWTVVPGFWNKVFVFGAKVVPNRWRAAMMRKINRVRGMAETQGH